MTSPLTLAPAARLRRSELEVVIQPAIGGAISTMRWREIDVLRKTPDSAILTSNVRQLSSYPLVPYSNRIGNAKLMVRDKTYHLRPNFANEPHAVHGVGWKRAWVVKNATEHHAVLTLKHTPNEDWPFAFEAEQVFTLTDNALTVSLRATNFGDAPMPIGLGFHPFFPIDTKTTLQATWKGMWEMNENKLPTTLIATPAHADFAKRREVFDWQVDNCFVGWGRSATVRYPTHTTTLTASTPCSNIVCFAPRDGRNFVALEPVSNINNAFALAAQGVSDTGMRILGRGDNMDISMTISVSPNPTTT